jgi:hypothetical protein
MFIDMRVCLLTVFSLLLTKITTSIENKPEIPKQNWSSLDVGASELKDGRW